MTSQLLTPPDRIYISDLANTTIERIVAQYRNHQLLKGGAYGMLFGWRPENTGDIFILEATQPSKQDSQGWNEVSIEEIARTTQKSRLSNHDIVYIGSWYLAPRHHATLQEEATQTASEILISSDAPVCEIVNLFISFQRGQPIFTYYYLNRDMAHSNPNCMVISNDKVKRMGRVQEEYHRLRREGYQIEMKQQENEYTFVVTTTDLKIYLVAATGYPIIPPLVVVERKDKEIAFKDGGIIQNWTSKGGHSYMVDIVRGIVEHTHGNFFKSKVALLYALIFGTLFVVAGFMVWHFGMETITGWVGF